MSSSVEAAWEAIAAQATGHVKDQPDYVVASMQKNGDLELIETGHGGAANGGGRGAVLKCMKANEDKVLVGVFKVTGVDHRETTVSFRSKFIHFVYKGTSAGVMLKAKVGVNTTKITEPFTGAHLFIKSDGDESDFDQDEISRQLFAIGGAHKPTKYDFNNEYEDELED